MVKVVHRYYFKLILIINGFCFNLLFLQYSQYPFNHLGQTAGSGHYSAQSTMYLQTAPQPHPPPGAAQAPPDIYSGMNSYRLSATAAYGQNQQINNPTTMLISTTSNTLMSASVKPSNQQISAIGKLLQFRVLLITQLKYSSSNNYQKKFKLICNI